MPVHDRDQNNITATYVFYVVPLILRDALQVTSQCADEAMTNTLKLAYELTGTCV